MVSSWTGDPTPERGGRAKKFFKLEAAGQQALRQAEEVTAAMSVSFPLSVVPSA
jgi:PadR family transcriptional regulator PadR